MTVRMPWSHIKLIALALLLTVLAHDAVMAGDPHAVPHHSARVPQAGDSASAAPAVRHDSVMPAIAHEHGGPVLVAGDETPCGPVVALRPPSPSDLLPDRAAAGVVRPLSADALPVPGPPRRDDPDHPPDVRRALLQVFLN